MKHHHFLSPFKFKTNIIALITTMGIGLALSACQQQKGPSSERLEVIETESQRLNEWFEARYEDVLALSPMSATYYGLDQDRDKLDRFSQLALDEEYALRQTWLAELKQNFDFDRLNNETQLSYRIYEYAEERRLAELDFISHDYVFQHMTGPHSTLPTFMINYHNVDDVQSAEDYISRLESFKTSLDDFIARAESSAQQGILLPKFVYPNIHKSAVHIVTGAPFSDQGSQSPLWKDISTKIDRLNISEAEKQSLKNQARSALLEFVGPAYANLAEMFERHEADADTNDGSWKLPDGARYYQSKLNYYTTTDMTADEIHEIGLSEVARIQNEMRDIMKNVGFEGSLQEFFTYLRDDPQFTLENNDSGREAYITQASEIIENMKEELDELFITKPKAGIVVKRVEPFREDTAFGAFYNSPSPDGSRPGTYYINLKNMNELPIYQMQALAYHEGIPGHHMQIAIAMELEDLPTFRTRGSFTPYVEGWALYSESIPKELGLYTDPYQDFGRLSMEIFRAVRLVVDTGIHSKKWTREEAIDYMMQNSANSEGDIRAEIDRYIVWPGQATAYKIGMLKIQELRQKAETELGSLFDIREFHDVILANGSVPLEILEQLVNDWIKTKKPDDE